MSNFKMTIEADREGLIEYLTERAAEAEELAKHAGKPVDKATARGRADGIQAAIRAITNWQPLGAEAEKLAGSAKQFAGFGGGGGGGHHDGGGGGHAG
jgi:hypothetical protein